MNRKKIKQFKGRAVNVTYKNKYGYAISLVCLIVAEASTMMIVKKKGGEPDGFEIAILYKDVINVELAKLHPEKPT